MDIRPWQPTAQRVHVCLYIFHSTLSNLEEKKSILTFYTLLQLCSSGSASVDIKHVFHTHLLNIFFPPTRLAHKNTTSICCCSGPAVTVYDPSVTHSEKYVPLGPRVHTSGQYSTIFSVNKDVLWNKHGLDRGDVRTDGHRSWNKPAVEATLPCRPETSRGGSVGNAAASDRTREGNSRRRVGGAGEGASAFSADYFGHCVITAL